MKTINRKQLRLGKETLARLTTSQLRKAAGGRIFIPSQNCSDETACTNASCNGANTCDQTTSFGCP